MKFLVIAAVCMFATPSSGQLGLGDLTGTLGDLTGGLGLDALGELLGSLRKFTRKLQFLNETSAI